MCQAVHGECMTYCANQLHLTTRSYFRIHLLLGCHKSPSDSACGVTDRLAVTQLVNLVVHNLKMLPLYILMSDARGKMHRTTQTRPTIAAESGAARPHTWPRFICTHHVWDRLDQRHLSSSVLCQFPNGAQDIQSQMHAKLVTSPRLSGTLPERETIKKKDAKGSIHTVCRKQRVLEFWHLGPVHFIDRDKWAEHAWCRVSHFLPCASCGLVCNFFVPANRVRDQK